MGDTILVTGGTGTLGRTLIDRLTAGGATVRVLSRRPRPASASPYEWSTGDLHSGLGLAEAVTGTDTIVHCATMRDDVAATRNLLAVAVRVGRPHLVYISIVGVDRILWGYYGRKLVAERLIADSGLPWTVLRATKFHDLIARGCEALARLPIVPLPSATSLQPIDSREVAARLAELATGPSAERVGDMAGPQVRPLTDLARTYLRAAGRRRPVRALWLPGRVAAALRRGEHLAPDHAIGRVTFDEFLGARFGWQR